nr:DUF423 domain-containing protein [uncultured Flavobacterium sp.]
MNKRIIITSGILGTLAIILGAFGAHALKKVLSVEELNSFEVGVRYQFYHTLFLLFIANTSKISVSYKKYISLFVTLGVILFSGSIYLLATQSLSGINFKFLGPITPIGGLMLIVGWILLIIGVCKGNDKYEN